MTMNTKTSDLLLEQKIDDRVGPKQDLRGKLESLLLHFRGLFLSRNSSSSLEP